MTALIVHCPRIDHRPVLLVACKFRYEGGHGMGPAPECSRCRAWTRTAKQTEVGELKPIRWPWEAKGGE